MRHGTWITFALLAGAPLSAHAEFLDCLFFDGFDGESAAPTAWATNLATHNCARKTVVPAPSVPIPPLHWSAALAQTAQTYANRCIWAHSGTSGLGENLYATSPRNDAQGAAAVSWAMEIGNYDYAANGCADGTQCGHYTQMVWRNTTEVGCGLANCSTGSPLNGFPNWTIVVCNYTPPGNFIGQRPY
jgi:pathogenesis-related protein 1